MAHFTSFRLMARPITSRLSSSSSIKSLSNKAGIRRRMALSRKAIIEKKPEVSRKQNHKLSHSCDASKDIPFVWKSVSVLTYLSILSQLYSSDTPSEDINNHSLNSLNGIGVPFGAANRI